MDRIQELMEKWKYKAYLASKRHRDWINREENKIKEEILDQCIADLRDTLLLIEADNFLK